MCRWHRSSTRSGNTPLVKLRSCAPSNGAELWPKLEDFNLSGSMKDRMALAMTEGAERDGLISPGDTIVEYTGGSTDPGDDEAGEMTLRLSREDGIFGGISTGANVVGAHRLERLGPVAVIVTLAVDTGFRYLSVSPFAELA